MRSLLHDYLTDDQSGTVSSRNPIASVNEVLRAAKTSRDHTKVRLFPPASSHPLTCSCDQPLFKFADSDLKASSKALKQHEDELNRALKFAVPGLMLDGPSQITVSASTNADGSYPGGLVAGSSRGGTHKALVSADSFNVSVLFGPTLAFLERVKEIMPGGSMGEYDTSSGFAGFLDDFVLRTFLPQLEEKVTSVFHQAVGGSSMDICFPLRLLTIVEQGTTRFKKIRITRNSLRCRSSKYVFRYSIDPSLIIAS